MGLLREGDMNLPTWLGQAGRSCSGFCPYHGDRDRLGTEEIRCNMGESITGVAKGRGFGANFKYIADQSGNVSWLFFTTKSHELAAFKDVAGEPGNYTFLNDPEACPWAIYHWFKEYDEMDE